MAASCSSIGTSCSALNSSTVKNGMPIQTLAIRIAMKAQPGEVRKPMGWLIRPMSPRIWLTAPASAWSRNWKMKPVISRGSSHGTMISERANFRSGNFRLNSRARLKPITNWSSSDRTVKLNVRTIALWVVACCSVIL